MASATITVTTVGTKTSSVIPFLKHTGRKIGLAFVITTLPTTLEVGFVNDEDDFIAFTDGAITATGTLVVNTVPEQGIAIRVTGGSPNFTVDFAGSGGRSS